jgi:bacteriorhodopsin
MDILLNKTVFTSLWVQILTGVTDIYVLKYNLPMGKEILRDLLKLEIFVQLIEGIFYAWLATNIAKVSNITQKRYYDWFITTPTMLLTFVVYLIYLNKGEHEEDSLMDKIRQNKKQLTSIVLLNIMMLGMGFLSETKLLNTNFAVLTGFIPFFTYFYIIWENYAKYTSQGRTLFWLFSSIWSLYGVAALLPYAQKNISYNILDLFSKNFFGVFLAYVVYKNRIQ